MSHAMFMPASTSTVPAEFVGEIGLTVEWVPVPENEDTPPGYYTHSILGEALTVHIDDLTPFVDPVPQPVPNRDPAEVEPTGIDDPYTATGTVTTFTDPAYTTIHYGEPEPAP